jgi:bis(5'-nucleosyl)-tetraphosphatase (symmetrical)
MATYAIGDLQGCFDPLRRLLDYIDFQPGRDRLWFVGDLVNRGPQSLDVLRFVKSLGTAAVTVLGNHDLHLVMQAEGYGKPNREDTLAPILNAPDRDELIAWLRSQPLCVTDTIADHSWLMVHAGVLPCWTAAKAVALGKEVSAALRADNYREFLANMWGSEPTQWSDELSGWDRLRVIVNAMTRMRYLTLQGAMEFRAEGNKAPPARGPANCVPWFDAVGRKSKNVTVVCGHWSGLGFLERPDLLAIDTGCLWGGTLTVARLDNRRVYQLPCPTYAKPSGWD